MKSFENLTWKLIKKFPDYEVSNNGDIRRKTQSKGAVSGKILKWHTCTSSGYPNIRLRNNGKSIGINVHKIVAITFIGKRPKGMQIRHIDGNKMNNNISNLCYGTSKENGQDKVRHGNSAKGVKNPKNKLTEKQVLLIRQMRFTKKIKEISKIFSISESNVYKILNRKYWNHI